jgi:hypothetical protein
MTPSPKRTHNLYFLRDKSKHFAGCRIVILIGTGILIRLDIPIMIKNKIKIMKSKWIESHR